MKNFFWKIIRWSGIFSWPLDILYAKQSWSTFFATFFHQLLQWQIMNENIISFRAFFFFLFAFELTYQASTNLNCNYIHITIFEKSISFIFFYLSLRQPIIVEFFFFATFFHQLLHWKIIENLYLKYFPCPIFFFSFLCSDSFYIFTFWLASC